MDLALNNLQRLIYHKTQTTNQKITEISLPSSFVSILYYTCKIWDTQPYSPTRMLEVHNFYPSLAVEFR